MKATHFDHQHNWWKYCECQDCHLGEDDFRVQYGGKHSPVPTDYKGGLHWEGCISAFAHEPTVFFVRCYHCDQLYVVLEPLSETPILYPVSRTEEDSLTWVFFDERSETESV